MEKSHSLNPNVQIVGDIFVTQKDLLKKGIEEKAGNSILIKLNQVGTLSETFETIALAKANGFWINYFTPIWRNRGHLYC